MNTKQCVLAYSGGLDTSAIIPWLVDRGFAVHAVLVDVGQDEDLEALCAKAKFLGAETAIVRDAKPEMFATVIPAAIALNATYEGTYRLGTALARPFIALEQVRRARELGGATLVHGATGKGNDQVRFEFAYRSLAPEYPVLAPWKTWTFEGRKDLIDYLKSKGFDDEYSVEKKFSLDENLWHLSVEGGPLEDPQADVDIAQVLSAVQDRFASGSDSAATPASVQIRIENGVPVEFNGLQTDLPTLVQKFNQDHRRASWAWDLVIENRMTGIKSRGLYINPAAKLLHYAVDAVARSCLNKPLYEQYVKLGQEYGDMLYRGEFFTDQRLVLEAATQALVKHLNGTVTVRLEPTPYVSKIKAADAIFSEKMATFESSDYSHQAAQGFISLSWLSRVGRPFAESGDENTVETGSEAASDICVDQSEPAGGLVSSSL